MANRHVVKIGKDTVTIDVADIGQLKVRYPNAEILVEDAEGRKRGVSVSNLRGAEKLYVLPDGYKWNGGDPINRNGEHLSATQQSATTPAPDTPQTETPPPVQQQGAVPATERKSNRDKLLEKSPIYQKAQAWVKQSAQDAGSQEVPIAPQQSQNPIPETQQEKPLLPFGELPKGEGSYEEMYGPWYTTSSGKLTIPVSEEDREKVNALSTKEQKEFQQMWLSLTEGPKQDLGYINRALELNKNPNAYGEGVRLANKLYNKYAKIIESAESEEYTINAINAVDASKDIVSENLSKHFDEAKQKKNEKGLTEEQQKSADRDMQNERTAKHIWNSTKEVLNQYRKQNVDGASFMGNVGRGFGHTITNLDTWIMDLRKGWDNAKVAQLLDKYDRVGEKGMSQSEKDVLDAFAFSQIVIQNLSADLGSGYNIGSSVAQSVPFMASMAATEGGMSLVGASTRAIAGRLARYGARHLGPEIIGATKAVTGTTKAEAMLGAVARGLNRTLANTIGYTVGQSPLLAGSAAAGYWTSKNEASTGQTLVGIRDDKGGIGEGLGIVAHKASTPEEISQAAVNGAYQQMIEIYSEGLGSGFNALGRLLKGSRALKATVKAFNDTKWGNFFADMRRSYENSSIHTFQRMAYYDGLTSEYLEEVAGTAMNALLNTGGGEWSDLVDWKQQLETLGSLAISQGFFSGASSASYISNRTKCRKAVEASDQNGQKLFGDEWDNIRGRLSNMDQSVEEVARILRDTSLDQEQKRAALDYYRAQNILEGANIASMKREEFDKQYNADENAKPKSKEEIQKDFASRQQFAEQLSNAYNEGANLSGDPETLARRKSQVDGLLEQTSERLPEEDKRAIMDAEDPYKFLEEYLGSNHTQAETMALCDYYIAECRKAGMDQAREEELNRIERDVSEEVEKNFVVKDQAEDGTPRSNNGKIVEVSLIEVGTPAEVEQAPKRYLVSGHLEINPNGTIDMEHSDQMVYVREAGSREDSKPASIGDITTARVVAEDGAAMAQQVGQEARMRAQESQSSPDYQRGNEVTLGDGSKATIYGYLPGDLVIVDMGDTDANGDRNVHIVRTQDISLQSQNATDENAPAEPVVPETTETPENSPVPPEVSTDETGGAESGIDETGGAETGEVVGEEPVSTESVQPAEPAETEQTPQTPENTPEVSEEVTEETPEQTPETPEETPEVSEENVQTPEENAPVPLQNEGEVAPNSLQNEGDVAPDLLQGEQGEVAQTPENEENTPEAPQTSETTDQYAGKSLQQLRQMLTTRQNALREIQENKEKVGRKKQMNQTRIWNRRTDLSNLLNVPEEWVDMYFDGGMTQEQLKEWDARVDALGEVARERYLYWMTRLEKARREYKEADRDYKSYDTDPSMLKFIEEVRGQIQELTERIAEMESQEQGAQQAQETTEETPAEVTEENQENTPEVTEQAKTEEEQESQIQERVKREIERRAELQKRIDKTEQDLAKEQKKLQKIARELSKLTGTPVEWFDTRTFREHAYNNLSEEKKAEFSALEDLYPYPDWEHLHGAQERFLKPYLEKLYSQWNKIENDFIASGKVGDEALREEFHKLDEERVDLFRKIAEYRKEVNHLTLDRDKNQNMIEALERQHFSRTKKEAEGRLRKYEEELAKWEQRVDELATEAAKIWGAPVEFIKNHLHAPLEERRKYGEVYSNLSPEEQSQLNQLTDEIDKIQKPLGELWALRGAIEDQRERLDNLERDRNEFADRRRLEERIKEATSETNKQQTPETTKETESTPETTEETTPEAVPETGEVQTPETTEENPGGANIGRTEIRIEDKDSNASLRPIENLKIEEGAIIPIYMGKRYGVVNARVLKKGAKDSDPMLNRWIVVFDKPLYKNEARGHPPIAGIRAVRGNAAKGYPVGTVFSMPELLVRGLARQESDLKPLTEKERNELRYLEEKVPRMREQVASLPELEQQVADLKRQLREKYKAYVVDFLGLPEEFAEKNYLEIAYDGLTDEERKRYDALEGPKTFPRGYSQEDWEKLRNKLSDEQREFLAPYVRKISERVQDIMVGLSEEQKARRKEILNEGGDITSNLKKAERDLASAREAERNLPLSEQRLNDLRLRDSQKEEEKKSKKDIKFRDQPEKSLVAVHNLTESDVRSALGLGGLAAPSVAVTEAEKGHILHGPISLILPKEAIDPRRSRHNHIFGEDAWTPTFPRLDPKVNEEVMAGVKNKLRSLIGEEEYEKEHVDGILLTGPYGTFESHLDYGRRQLADEPYSFYYHERFMQDAYKADTGNEAENDKGIITQEYRDWVNNLFDGVVEKWGFRNEKDPFTPYGNRRSWESTHEDLTMDNVLKAMRRKEVTNSAEGGSQNFFAAAEKEYKSIDEARRDAKKRIDRTVPVPRFEESGDPTGYIALRTELQDRLDAVKEESGTNNFIITDAIKHAHTPQGIYDYVRREYPGTSMTVGQAQEVDDIRKAAAELPARFLEAKPMRAVGFDEVQTAVVPKNTDPELIRRLQDAGVEVRTYETGNDEDRKKVVEEAAREADILFRDQQTEADQFSPRKDNTKAEAKRMEAQVLSEQLSTPIRIVENVDEITDDDPATQARMRRAYGWYDPSTGEVVVVLPNCKNVGDVQQTIFHELVGHKGMAELMGQENYDAMCEEVFDILSQRDPETARSLRERYGDKRAAGDEYIASLAEGMNNNKAALRRVIGAIRRWLSDTLGIKLKISDNDLMYLLWKSRNNLMERGGGDLMSRAAEVAAQNSIIDRLGIRPGAQEQSKRAPVMTRNSEGEERFSPVASELDSRGLSFRDGDNIDQVDNTAREIYEAWAKKPLSKFWQGYFDDTVAVKNLQDAIIKQTGGKIDSSTDVWNALNHLTSVETNQFETFNRTIFKPLLEAVSALRKQKGVKLKDVYTYMMAKSGLERNEIMAMRDANNSVRDGLNSLQTQLKNGQITQAQYQTSKANLMAQRDAAYQQNRTRDYSGLTSLMGEQDVAAAESMAQQFVDDFEYGRQQLIDDFWSNMNKATNYSMQKLQDSGVLSRRQRAEIQGDYHFYVPLRGWEETTAEDAYDYMYYGQSRGSRNVVERAQGRRSKADNPLVHVLQMAQNAIARANENEVKQKLYNLARKHPTSLLTIGEGWIENKGTAQDPQWELVTPQLTNNMTPDDVAQAIRDFGRQMADRARMQGSDWVRKLNLSGANPPYRVPQSRESAQHAVRVRIGGQDQILYVNGNPRAAQAVNGLLSNLGHHMPQWYRTLNRNLASMMTSMNPYFIGRNLSRDTMTALENAGFDGWDFQKSYFKNMASLYNPKKGIGSLFYKYNHGTLNDNVKMDRYFKEFMEGGGETGYYSVQNIDRLRARVNMELRETSRPGIYTLLHPWNVIRDVVGHGNRLAENLNRFATFVASREAGKDAFDAVTDAKNITVNFNRRGSGEAGAWVFREFFLFTNPALQSMNLMGHLFRDNPIRASWKVARLVGIGMMEPYLNDLIMNMFGGYGDDGNDKYANDYNNLPEYLRRQCFMIPIGGGNFLITRMSMEYRPFYAVGTVLADMWRGNIKKEHIVETILSQFASSLPWTPMDSGDFPKDAIEWVLAITPAALQPLAELLANRDWLGRSITTERNDYNRTTPAYAFARRSTPDMFVGAADWLNRHSGGNEALAGAIDVDPNKLWYLIKNYLPGVTDVMVDVTNTAHALLDPELEVENYYIPGFRSFVNEGGERNRDNAITGDYYYYMDEIFKKGAELERKANNKKKATDQDKENWDQFRDTPEGQIYEIYKYYKKDIDKARKARYSAETEEDREDARKEQISLSRDLLNDIDAEERQNN